MFSVLQSLNTFLLKNFPSVVFEAGCKKSELYDEDDMKGQDILWSLKSSVGEGDGIIQVKSSSLSARKFNEIAGIRFSGQENAYFKKAFNGNMRRRKNVIMQELLQEAITAGLLPVELSEVLERF